MGHNYIGHNYIGRDYIGRNYMGHNFFFRRKVPLADQLLLPAGLHRHAGPVIVVWAACTSGVGCL